MKKRITAILVLMTLIGTGLSAQEWKDPDPAALEKWKNMRFGMFIHWGPVSLTGHEIGWSRGKQTPVEEYDNLYKRFNPVDFNADEWVSIAKAAGMKYMVLTTKHHDGFCLWDTKLTDYNIMNTPFKRDVVKELSEACKKQGIKFGAYYSVADWYHPDFSHTYKKIKRDTYDLDAYGEYLRGQIKELIVNYGPLVTIWNDVSQDFRERGLETIKMVRELQPDILINNRTGAGGDYGTPEQRIGGFDIENPWESCMTVSAHNHWAWGGYNDGVKSLSTCLLMLIRASGGDGNVLLNVGPRPDGVIDPEQANRLREMGDWLKKYGESIYETRGGPYTPTKVVASTRKGNNVYIHITEWPEETLVLPPLPAKILKSSLLTGGEVTVKQTEESLEISVPVANRQDIDTIVKLELDQPAMSLNPIELDRSCGNLVFEKKATASNVYQNNKRYAASKAADSESETRWATDADVDQCWLEVDLGKPETIARAVIEEFSSRIKSFELQRKDGDSWKTFYQGGEINNCLAVDFEPVTAQVVRLLINGKGGPSLYEFQLFAPEKK